MSNTIILITNEYPYSRGEEFLENEMEYISAGFENRFIFSINGKKEHTATRCVPKGTEAYPLNNETSKWKYIKYLFEGIAVHDKHFKIRECNLSRIFVSLYCRGRGYQIAKSIYRIISKKILGSKEITIYSYWFSYQAVAAVILGELLKSDGFNVKIFSRAHGYDLYWERVRGGFHPFQSNVIEYIDACFPCSEFGRRYLLEKYPEVGNKVATMRLGTKDHGLNPYAGEKVILSCCYLEPLKRISMLAKAFGHVVSDYPELKWICIGDGEEKEAVINIIKNGRNEERVEMLGRLTNREVIDIYKTRGIMYFLNVSTTEGVPVSVMEAQSFGVPVIATNAGGTGELVNEENGMIIPVEIDEYELARRIKVMLGLTEEVYFKKRIASRENWMQKSSAEKVYADFTSRIK